MSRRVRRTIFLVLFALAVVAGFLLSRGTAPKLPKHSWLFIELDGAFSESAPDGLLGRLVERRRTLLETVGNLEKAAHDPRIDGAFVRVGSLDGGWAQAEELRTALEGLQQRDKRVVAFLRADGPPMNKEYYVVAGADRIYVAPGGAPLLNGLAAHFTFLGGVWEKTDIQMDVERIREYKTFADTLVRKQMSKAHREMADSILDSVDRAYVGGIATGRGMSEQQVRAIIDRCPTTPDAFVEAGLADGVLFFDQVRNEISDGSDDRIVNEKTYSRVPRSAVGLGGGDKIAVVHAVGTIVPGKGDRRSMLGVTLGADTIAKALEDAADDEDVRAIVLRIDSPGGSASASDQLWRAVREAGRRKPVVASLGDVAASGGYYMASAASRVLAAGTSLTGSIGVVSFKPNVSGLLGDVGVHTEVLSRGRYARLFDLTKSLDDDERALLRLQMEHTYRLFLERVAEARAREVDAVDAVGGGRVWTGSQAVEHGLVDDLGGLRDAIRAAAQAAGIENVAAVELVFYPEPAGFWERLTSLGGVTLEAALAEIEPRLLSRIRAALEAPAGVHALAVSIPEIR